MKIFHADQIKKADAYTIQHEPVSSIDLMERAATKAYKWLKKRVSKQQQVLIFCGVGNNGGDGLVIARKLLEQGYHVHTYIVHFSENQSEDFKKNLQLLSKKNITSLNEHEEFPEIPAGSIVVDAIFGSGLNRPVKGWIAQLIQHINTSKAMRVAIDIPSGLFSEDNDENKEAIVQAHFTLSFQFPKLAFLFPQNAPYVGQWEILPIGLHEDFIVQEKATEFYITSDLVQLILKRRPKYGHKGTFGHALIIAGSKGKIGANILASKACLRSGVGLLTSYLPECGYTALQTALPEAMCLTDDEGNKVTHLPNISNYTGVGIGPGIGIEKATQNVVKLLIQNSGRPVVFDADAINILAENKTWLEFIPHGSILTPHPGEFARLVGKIGDDYKRFLKLKEFAIRYKIFVVLKGAHSAIATPSGEVFFNSTGNPGMATAGSGDVLTGILTSLLAQGYSSGKAVILGVWLHGKAGDIAAKKNGEYALIASDIIANIKGAYDAILKQKD